MKPALPKYFWIILILIGTGCLQVSADDSLIQVPDQCLNEKVTPCLVKANTSVQVTVAGIELRLIQGVLFKVVKLKTAHETNELVILAGRLKIKTADNVIKLNGLDVKPNSNVYVYRVSDEIQLLDSVSLDLKTLKTEAAQEDFVLVKGEFLDRKKFVQTISEFSRDLNEFKKDLSELSSHYSQRLNQEVANQTKVLQRKIASEIADLETEKRKLEFEKAEEKKLRKLFFKRTFQR